MPENRPNGFTLIELIIIIVIAAVVASAAGQFASTSIGRSAQSSTQLQDQLALRNAMEEMVIYYRDQLAQDTLTLPNVLAHANAIHAALVEAGNTGYVTFSDPEADKTYASSAVSGSYASGRSLLLTLQRNGQRVCALFTE